jgi:hypothetical protein
MHGETVKCTSVCLLIYDLVSKKNNSVDADEIYYTSSPQTVVRQAPGFLKIGAYFAESRKFLPTVPIFLDWLE